MLIYNIPYRTAVNLANDSLLELAETRNIVGVKDSSGSLAQSLDLLIRKPRDFAVLTGEDALFFTMMANGADGGILAASHLMTGSLPRRRPRLRRQRSRRARAPPGHRLPASCRCCSPRPIRCRSSICLWRQGLIASPECRLPLSRISDGLAQTLDGALVDASGSLTPDDRDIAA